MEPPIKAEPEARNPCYFALYVEVCREIGFTIAHFKSKATVVCLRIV